MGDLTVGAVIQVNLSCFVLLYSNTATQKTFLSDKDRTERMPWWVGYRVYPQETVQLRQQMNHIINHTILYLNLIAHRQQYDQQCLF